MQTENVNIGSKRSPGDKAVSDDELQGVAKVVNALLMAYRNYTIYPEGHATSRKSIENLLSAFNDFFPAFDDLRLHVEKERLLYSDTVVHQAEPDSATDDIPVSDNWIISNAACSPCSRSFVNRDICTINARELSSLFY